MATPGDLGKEGLDSLKKVGDSDEYAFDRDIIGRMDQSCDYCSARYWIEEVNSNGKFTRCCQLNTIRLPPMQPPTELMNQLFIGHSADSNLFLNKVSK